MRWMHTIISLAILSLSVMAKGQDSLSVAERNAAQGFNDTIDRLAPDFVLVSLCVADPTDQSQDYLGMTGHSFLRLQCYTFGMDYCYSYETEKIKGQVWDYIVGKLRMKMVSLPTDVYVEDYRVWKRAVHEYRLNLPPEAKLRLWEQMDNHVWFENEKQLNLLKYGCANTILRYVERALKPDTISYHWPEKYLTKSANEIAEEHFECYPWTLLGMKLTMGKQLQTLQSPKQKIIFPTDLLEVWSTATIGGNPILEYIGDIVDAEPVVVEKPWFTPQLCGVLFLIIVAGGIIWAMIRKRKS